MFALEKSYKSIQVIIMDILSMEIKYPRTKDEEILFGFLRGFSLTIQ